MQKRKQKKIADWISNKANKVETVMKIDANNSEPFEEKYTSNTQMKKSLTC